MNLSSPFILRPVMTTLFTFLMVIGGIFAYTNLPINDLPAIEKPIIKIQTSYTGASPLTVLNQVTIPLEKELLHVSGVQEMVSYSLPGQSEIALNFDFTTNMNEALRATQAAIMRADSELPRTIQRPSYQVEEGGNESILYLVLSSEYTEKKGLENYAETVVLPKLNRIDGVAKVKVFGAKNSLWLQLKPDVMAARGVGFNQVIESLKAHLSEKPLGSISRDQKKIYLELTSEIDDQKSLEELRIGSVRLKDIGTFSYQSKEDRDVYFLSDEGKAKAILFGIQKVRGSNTVAIAKEVEKSMKEMQKLLPPGLHLNIWFNKATWIEEALFEMKWSLGLALVLVTFVIYFHLRKWREALIPSLSLPLSILATFTAMYFLNFSLDLLSLLALTLSIGFIVDDAIIVAENISRHQEKGLDPLTSSIKGTKEISFTVLAMTLSLVAVFIPLLFMGGMNGRLFREFSITLSLAILFSAVVSLTLIPLLCSRLTTHTTSKKDMLGLSTYGKILRFCLEKPLPVSLLSLSLIGMSYFLFTQLPVQIFPEEDRGFILGSIQAPLKLEETIQETLLENGNVKNFLDIHFDERHLFLIRLAEKHAPEVGLIRELQNTLNKIPGVYANFTPYQMIQMDFELGSTGRYKYTLQGTRMADIEETTEALVQAIRSSGDFTAVRSAQSPNSPKIEISVDQKKAKALGLTRQQIQEVFSHAYGQNPIGYLQKGIEQTPILLDLQAEDLTKLSFINEEGNPFPMHTIGTLEEKVSTGSLHQLDHFPAANIRFSLKEGISPNEGLKKMETLAKKVLPSSVSGKFTGLSRIIEGNQRELQVLLLIASLAMYIVLGVLYESFIHPLTILSSLPFACFGGILTLFIFNEPLSLFSSMGFLLLIGIVKKNGIMIVDYALEKQKTGASPKIAVYEACMVRFRPIMMTTFAGVLGALPLTFGSPIHRGLGLVIAGGLLFSQGLTLIITPLLYLGFAKLSSRSRPRPQSVIERS